MHLINRRHCHTVLITLSVHSSRISCHKYSYQATLVILRHPSYRHLISTSTPHRIHKIPRILTSFNKCRVQIIIWALLLQTRYTYWIWSLPLGIPIHWLGPCINHLIKHIFSHHVSINMSFHSDSTKAVQFQNLS